MSTVRIKIEPAILEWVQNQVNIDNIKQSLRENFLKWLSGEKEPTFRQIEDLSKVTHIPLGYFFLETPPIEDKTLIEFRTIESTELLNPSRDLLDTITEMENIQTWMVNHLEEDGFEKLTYVGTMKKKNSIEEVASDIRDKLSLNINWFEEFDNAWESFKGVRTKLETVGIIVMMNGIVGANTHRALNINEFRAFTLVDDIAPLIFINSNDSNGGRLFSLLHEITHIWCGVNSLFNDNSTGTSSINELEVKCNAIAAELLVPHSLFVSKWMKSDKKNSVETVQELSKFFNCGITVIARRAYDNGFITNSEYIDIANSAIDSFKLSKSKKKSGGDYYNTALTRIDKRVLNAMYDSAYGGNTSFTEVYRLTHTSRKTFDSLVQKSRGDIL